MIVVAGIWKVKESGKKAFIAACQWIKGFSKEDEGYLSYSFNEDKITHNQYLFFEEWKDRDAIENHVNQWYFREFMNQVEPLLESKPIIRLYSVSEVIQL